MTTTETSTKAGVRVELRGLRRSFGDVHALDGMNLDMTPGELVVLLGPSGCGKTTALRVLAGLEDADAGQVVVAGKDISSVATSKRDMGMVFQAYSLFPHMTARDNVAFGLQLRGQNAGSPEQAGRRIPGAGRVGQPCRSICPPDVRRPAAAGGVGQGVGHPTQGAAAGRAVVGARRQGAGAAPGRDPPDPARGRHYHPVRHPRSGRGTGRRRPGRRDAGRQDRADRPSRRHLLCAEDGVRRAVHRIDEQVGRQRRRRRGLVAGQQGSAACRGRRPLAR